MEASPAAPDAEPPPPVPEPPVPEPPLPEKARLLRDCFAAAVSPGAGVHLSPVPEKKLLNARKTFAREIAADERAVVFVDFTAFGTGKRGILFTDRRCLHATASPGACESLEYDDIRGCALKRGFPHYDLSVILANGASRQVGLGTPAAQGAFEAFCGLLAAAKTA
ncbi:MAG: hypothetical protein FJ225_08385 [Lentisphaerae bacterium]|nr:hypothetical protein [Lentisphaerota bacterium]